MIDIRAATSTDVPLLEDMYRKEIEDHPERAQRFAEELVLRYKTLLAIKENSVCGTITWKPRGGLDDGVIELVGLGVNEGFKRQGIATKLVDAMIAEVSQFYSANRFKEVANIPSLYPQDDASIWTRHL